MKKTTLHWRALLMANALLCLLGCASPSYQASSTEVAQQDFFDRWQALCGARFEGHTTFPEEPSEAFRGKKLVATVATCNATEIRIPFAVGADRSRTWVLTQTKYGALQLKHDHRHEDGTPDEINYYGGMATENGTASVQSFAADPHTARIIPEAASNVWQISLSQDGRELVYYLERHAQPRFRAQFVRVN